MDVRVEYTEGGGWAGYVVIWYRDDDGGSGYGSHAEEAHWCGTREACEERADGAAPLFGWHPVAEG